MNPTREEVARIAGSLSKAQRDYVLGRYDDEFVSHGDAACLERAGVWVIVDPDDQNEWPRLKITPLGLAVRSHLQEPSA